MRTTEFEVVLTNGTVKHTYSISAFSEREATILAQAEAIKSARGYDFVSVSVKDKPDAFVFFLGEHVPVKITKEWNGKSMVVKFLKNPSVI